MPRTLLAPGVVLSESLSNHRSHPAVGPGLELHGDQALGGLAGSLGCRVHGLTACLPADRSPRHHTDDVDSECALNDHLQVPSRSAWTVS